MDEKHEPVTRRAMLQAAAAVLATGAVFIAARYTRPIESIEVGIYDRLVSQRASTEPSPHPIVLVELTEKEIDDLEFWDYPVSDERLAEVLSAICRRQPVVVGVDIYRSKPVPKDGSQLDALERVLRENENIFMPKKFGAGDWEIPALEMLGEDRSRVGFVDFPVDAGWNHGVRRGLFAMSVAGEDPWYSLGSLLAARFLQSKGIVLAPDRRNPDQVLIGDTPMFRFRSFDGAYSRQDDAGYQFFLDLLRKGPLPAFSFREVIDPAFPAEGIRGKIVLVGVTAESVQDSASTPLRFDHRGLDLHAQVVEQLLNMGLHRRLPLRVLPDWLENLGILLAIALAGLLGFRLRRLDVLLLSLPLLAFLVVVFGWWLFQDWGIWIPIATPAAGVIAGGISVSLVKVLDDRLQTRVFRRLLFQYLNPEFAKEVWKERNTILVRGRIPGRELTATVVMTDLVGFSRIASQIEPKTLFDWSDEYLGLIATIIAEHGGAVKDFAGDAVHGVFGVPVKRNSPEEIARDARNAVASALSMEKELLSLNRSFRERDLPEARMRVGISTGKLIAGSIGSSHLMRFEFIGETVNIAARLESLILPGEPVYHRSEDHPVCRIIISESTWECLDGAVDGEKVSGVELKGMEGRPFTVYRIKTPSSDFNHLGPP